MMFSRKLKQAGALLLAAAALTACGRTSEPTAAQTPGTVLSSGPATGTITIWAQGADAEALPAFTKEFEAANPGVKVNVTAIPWDAAYNKYQTAIASGSTPDVAQMGTTWMGDFSDAFDPTPQQVDTKDLFPSAVNAATVNGTMRGVPWYVDTRVVYYRTDLAKQAGFTAAPTTWDDFKAMAKAMQAKAGAKYGVRLLSNKTGAFQDALIFPWSNGAQMLTTDGAKWNFDNAQWSEAFSYYQSFFKEGIANKSPSIAAGAAISEFIDGTVPMFIGGPSDIAALNEAGGNGFSAKFATATLPKKVSSTSFLGGSVFTVFQKSQNRDAAWKFVQFMSDPKIQVKWQQAAGGLPSAQAAWQDDTLAKDPKLSVFGDQLKDADSPPALTTYTQVAAAGDTQLEQMVRSDKDPAQAMKDLQAEADSIGTGQ